MDDTADIERGQLEQWFDTNLILLLVTGMVLVLVYVFASRIIHMIVNRVLAMHVTGLDEGSVEAAEMEKRSATLESLITTLVRLVLATVIVVLVIGLFGLWGVLTGAALFLAALTLAGQSIVLDYLMGILIVFEGTYFKGDSISSGDPQWGISGTVEDVGLRRTVVRSPDGTVHSISNGLMRQVSNRTRIFAAAEVRLRGIREEDFEPVVRIMDDVGRAIAADPLFANVILEAPTVVYIADPDELGWSATMRGKVIAGSRWTVATEVRRRLSEALLAADIELNKRGVSPRIARDDRAGRAVREASLDA
jgi:small conductance mechanosensitive channel